MAQSKRIQEVRLAVAQFLGCNEQDLRAATSKILICDKHSLKSVVKSLTSSSLVHSASNQLLRSAVGQVSESSGRWIEEILAQSRAAEQARDRAVTEILEKSPEGGIILREGSGRPRWQMILPDVGEPGRWRAQAFDDRGFSGHSVFDTQKKALEDVWQQGYSQRDDQALDRMQDAPSFVRGNYLSELVRKVNLRQLTMDAADLLLSEYDRANALKSELAGALTQALYEPVSDTIVLVADQIQPGQETAVLLHEIVHKHGPWTLGRGFGRLVDQVIAWRDRDGSTIERQIFDVAHERASLASGKEAGVDPARSLYVYRQEILAYAVEAAVAMGVRPARASERTPGNVGDDAEHWLADVVDTFRGLRAQLLNAPTEPVSLSQVVDMAYALAQLETPDRAAQVIARLREGAQADPELSAWVEDLAQKMTDFAQRRQLSSAVHGNPTLINDDDRRAVADMPAGADPALVVAISSVYAHEDFWRVMVEDSAFNAGPFDGGCLVCARAIIQAAGRGTLVRIASDVNAAEHYGAEIDGIVYDFYGAHATGDEWVRSFIERESLESLNRSIHFARGYAVGIVDDVTTQARVADMLSVAMREARDEKKQRKQSSALIDHWFMNADIDASEPQFSELEEILSLQRDAAGIYPWAAMIRVDELTQDARKLIERKMGADLEGGEMLTLKLTDAGTQTPASLRVQAVVAPLGAPQDPRIVHVTAAAEAFFKACQLEVIPDEEIAVWNELSEGENSDQVVLDGWVLEGDRVGGRYELEREFYVRDPQGVDLGFWRCARVTVADHVIVAGRILDHEDGEVEGPAIVVARERLLSPGLSHSGTPSKMDIHKS